MTSQAEKFEARILEKDGFIIGVYLTSGVLVKCDKVLEKDGIINMYLKEVVVANVLSKEYFIER